MYLKLGNKGIKIIEKIVSTKIRFREIRKPEIDEYVATGEPLNCAGGFSLDGKGGIFISSLEGCYSNVIGLSLPWLSQVMLSSN